MIIVIFSHNILGYSDAAQLQRWSTDAVTELVLRCLCLLTQPVGMASKSTTAAKYIYDTLVMVSLGALKMTFAGKTVYPCGSIDTNFDPP